MISEIIKNQTVSMKNVLYYKAWVTPKNSDEHFRKMNCLIDDRRAKKVGSIIIVSNAVKNKEGEALIEIEVFVPLDKKIVVTNEFKFISKMIVMNAIKIRIEGGFVEWQRATNVISEYIRSSNLQPTTPIMIKMIKAPIEPLDSNEMIIEIYVGTK